MTSPARKGPFRLDLPAGPIQPGITAAQAETAWLRGEEPVPTPQPTELSEMTDEEADALWASPVRPPQPQFGEQMHAALFGDTRADSPEEANELGWQ